MQTSKRYSITTIGLHSVAWTSWRERRRNHDAFMLKLGDLSVDRIAAGTGFVAKAQRAFALSELCNEAHDSLGFVHDGSHESHFTAAGSLGNCHRDRFFVYIQTDKKRILLHGSSPCVRLGTAHPVQPSAYTPRGEPLNSKRTLGPPWRKLVCGGQWPEISPPPARKPELPVTAPGWRFRAPQARSGARFSPSRPVKRSMSFCGAKPPQKLGWTERE
jgi:hypothetical protein